MRGQAPVRLSKDAKPIISHIMAMMGFADVPPLRRDKFNAAVDYWVTGTSSSSGLSLSMILSSIVRAGLSARF